jgi:hypothetical protein
MSPQGNVVEILPRIKASTMKCAVRGCHNPKVEDSDFCVHCLATRRSRPLTHKSCDNLKAIRED